jgi:membrane-associated phospholipid phosphatase
MQDVARFIAAHPLILFVALTLLMLVGGVLLWWLALRIRDRAQQLPWFASGRLPFDLLVGFLIVISMLTLFLSVADEIGIDETLGRFDDLLAAELRQTLEVSTLRIFALVTRLGDAWWLALVCAVVAVFLVYRRRFLLAAGWVAAVAGNGLLNRGLKALFERTRPLHDHGWAMAQGWSFPSGHSSGALVTYGMLAYLIVRYRRPPGSLAIVLVATSVILGVGYSRIVLQVHYFSDVLAGFASGSLWLMATVIALEMAQRRRAAG